MKTQRTIERELRKAEARQMIEHGDERTDAELYGIVQALAWVLGQDAASPVAVAEQGWPGRVEV